MALRRQICERFIREPGYRFVELPDPPRAKDGDYRQAVADWHAARARVWAEAIESELEPGGVGAFLAWGDPSLYDSTLRILDTVAARVDIDYDVIPGITAIQALTARHRIPLNDVGEPVLDHHRQAAARQRAVRQRRGDARRVTVRFGAARRRPGSGGAPIWARRTSCWWPAPSAKWATRSPSCAPRPAPGTAGSWTPTCCVPPTDRPPWQDQRHGELPPARRADRGRAVGGHPRSFPASASSAGTPRWRGSASSSSSR